MTIRSQEELEGLKRVGKLVAQAILKMSAAAQPGITTRELDAIGAEFLRSQGARSGPQIVYKFPGFNCISVNDQIVHGVPNKRLLKPGDAVKLDVTAELDGFYADSATTVVLDGEGSEEGRKMLECAKSAFQQAMKVAKAETRVNEIGRAIEREVRRHGFAVVKDLTGHGVGRSIHEPPSVPNFYHPMNSDILRDGMVIAVEPIISSKPARTVTGEDGWTMSTHNKALAAHYEHTVVITPGEPIILTAA
ncbi:MAG TPA: type I methionyl aminopeptidase [Candidatus Koribacter sp.]|jgi:methionyl aminopeptidase